MSQSKKVTQKQVNAAFRTIRKCLDQLHDEVNAETARAYDFIGKGGAGEGEDLCCFVEALGALSSTLDSNPAYKELDAAEAEVDEWIEKVKNTRYDLRHAMKK